MWKTTSCGANSRTLLSIGRTKDPLHCSGARCCGLSGEDMCNNSLSGDAAECGGGDKGFCVHLSGDCPRCTVPALLSGDGMKVTIALGCTRSMRSFRPSGECAVAPFACCFSFAERRTVCGFGDLSTDCSMGCTRIRGLRGEVSEKGAVQAVRACDVDRDGLDWDLGVVDGLGANDVANGVVATSS